MLTKSNSSLFRELYEERAGILEFEAGFDRKEAELYAYVEIMKQLNG